MLPTPFFGHQGAPSGMTLLPKIPTEGRLGLSEDLTSMTTRTGELFDAQISSAILTAREIFSPNVSVFQVATAVLKPAGYLVKELYNKRFVGQYLYENVLVSS